jgi:hypothetical protein
MIGYHGDPVVIGTQGDRGKTTRRKSTRTVRGAEGRWIADTKGELAKRPAGWLVKQEMMYRMVCDRHFTPRVSAVIRCDTEAQAQDILATLQVGPEHMHRGHNGDCYLSRVWVEREVK